MTDTIGQRKVFVMETPREVVMVRAGERRETGTTTGRGKTPNIPAHQVENQKSMIGKKTKYQNVYNLLVPKRLET